MSTPHPRPFYYLENFQTALAWLRQRYAEVLATWDEYVEPMIQLVNADGAFEQGVRKVETVLLKLLGEQARLPTRPNQKSR